MKKAFINYSFLLPAILFLVHQIIQKGFQINLPILDAYLDPFCLGALAVPIMQYERKLFFNQAHFQLIEVIISAIVLIAFSEGLLPLLSNNFIADPWDVVFILIGIGWFLIFNPTSFCSLRKADV